MVPDKKDMLALVTGWEETLNMIGWDQPALLAGLYRDTGTGAMFVMPMNVHLGDIDEHIPTAIERIRRHFEIPRGTGFPSFDDDDDPEMFDAVVGLGLHYEAWMTLTAPEDRPQGLGAADMPDGVEVRGLLVVDCGGRFYASERRRGGDRDLMDFTAAEAPKLRTVGEVAVDLVRMLKAMMRSAPPGSVDMAALNALIRTVSMP